MSFKKSSVKKFVADMVKFYRASGVDEEEISEILDEYEDVIPRYLMATPGLIARKLQDALEHNLIFR